MELGHYGVWTSYRSLGEDNAAEAAKLVEDLGFGTFWLGGSPKVPDTRPLLAATTNVTVATGILNIWQNDPADTAAAHHELTAEFPDRFLLGVGAGHPEATSDYTHPLKAMREFLDGLDAAPQPVPQTERCIAALGPKMLDLCGRRSLGSHTYFVPVEHTRAARERLGPNKLVAPELACVLDPDPETARATARAYAKLYLGLTNYTRNLLRYGFTESDVAGGGSDRLIDAVIPHGTAEEIAAVAEAHRDAGADHVCLQPVGISGVPRDEWTALASALALN
jgi:probable F420-dependent oxidoreductase